MKKTQNKTKEEKGNEKKIQNKTKKTNKTRGMTNPRQQEGEGEINKQWAEHTRGEMGVKNRSDRDKKWA